MSKRAADDFLRGLDVAWFVLQPSLVYGEHAQQSTAFFHALAALPVQVLPDGGGQLLQPIHIDDLVAVVCHCLDASANTRQTLALVGPEPLCYSDLLLNLRLRLGKALAKTINLPQKWLLHLASLSKFLDTPILAKDNIPMLYRNNIGDPAAITAILGRPPLSIHQQLFAKPASTPERWHAHLYFLKPLMPMLIALVWLWSGITSLFFYPHQASYELLAETGVTGIAAPFTLYGLAFMDIGLGLATLARYRWQALLKLQMAIVLVYTLVISVALPEFWLHPFGPILKNLPFLMVLWICAIINR
ncbi:MAG: SDR family oxidoreductase [Methylovulum miyakonense]|uniref:SDR family oxidoreductase n=1 Tax=Methylovulum miyakonense TaxID=645578 RepID=UPI003BB6B416